MFQWRTVRILAIPSARQSALVCAAVLAFYSLAAAGHGGVSIEDDRCVMTIGPYQAHFSGYQPQVRASQEFCEDIPVVADAIIVLDFISQPLRQMQVDFRIVRDVKSIGVNATYADLGSSTDIEAATVVYRPPARYPNGNFDIKLSFEAAGTFIGVMKVVDDANAREYISVFPFSVGQQDWWGPLKWVIVVLAIGAGAYFFSNRTTRKTEAS